MYATPFVLQPDHSNKYQVDRTVEKSVEQSNTTMIPFLRNNENTGSPRSFNRTFNQAAYQITGGRPHQRANSAGVRHVK